MGGSKTRFGFVGGSDPPDSEEHQSARTVFGHDIHLQLPPGFTPPRPPGSPTPLPPPARTPWTAAAPVPIPVSEQESTSRVPRGRPSRPSPSRLARFLGYWTGSGRFISKSRLDLEAGEDVELPRDTTGRNVLLVLLVAGLTFGATFAIVKLRQRHSGTAPEPPAPAMAPPQAAPVATPPAAAAPPAAVAPAPVIPPPAALPAASASAQPVLLPPVPAAKGLGGGALSPKPHKPERSSRLLAAPPAHLKGELLPLAP